MIRYVLGNKNSFHLDKFMWCLIGQINYVYQKLRLTVTVATIFVYRGCSCLQLQTLVPLLSFFTTPSFVTSFLCLAEAQRKHSAASSVFYGSLLMPSLMKFQKQVKKQKKIEETEN